MTSAELNFKLTETFPELAPAYREETAWQDGDDTGSHVIYTDVFVPFIKAQMQAENEQMIERIFAFVEELLSSDDAYASEVIFLSVLESLVFDEEVDHVRLVQSAKGKTLQALREILGNIAL